MRSIPTLFLLGLTLLALSPVQAEESHADPQWVEYVGTKGPGVGKTIVLISGDDEYRSEEALPMLGQILAKHHGFHCYVLFSTNPKTGEITPTEHVHCPGLHLIDQADLVVLLTRFREWPDDQMQHFVDYINAGKPLVALRTATHAFHYEKNRESKFLEYDWRSKQWPGGFGQQILGDTWISHHGKHKKESCRGIINKQHASHPILNGVSDLWGPSDVYGIKHLPESASVLVHGQILTGMKPTDPAVEDQRNDPMMPIAWLLESTAPSGKSIQSFCNTFCSSVDLECEDLRRMIVNACYWQIGLGEAIPEKANVEYVTEYKPTFFGFGTYTKGVFPKDYVVEELLPEAK